jgi:hypothetical protein
MGSTMDVSELASKVKGTILTPGDEGYEDSLKRWASNTEKRAAVVALVKCAEDVSAAVIPQMIY